MEIVGLTGIGMTSGMQVLAFDAGAMSAALIAVLAVSAGGIVGSRLIAHWRAVHRPALRLHPAVVGGG
jgi:hypothetical protein